MGKITPKAIVRMANSTNGLIYILLGLQYLFLRKSPYPDGILMSRLLSLYYPDTIMRAIGVVFLFISVVWVFPHRKFWLLSVTVIPLILVLLDSFSGYLNNYWSVGAALLALGYLFLLLAINLLTEK